MPEALHLERRGELAVLRLGREHGNALNGRLIDELLQAVREIDGDPEVRGVLLAASGKLFCPGLDLQELIELDRPAMQSFVLRFNSAILSLYTLARPVVAALHGHAVAGGCVLALTADWRVLARGALVGLNEVKVGVPLPFGVSMILRETVPRTSLEEVAMFGRNYRDEEAVRSGLVHEVVEQGDAESRALERLEELASRDATAFAITKRYLRAATVERIRAHDPHFTGDFLDAWFSPTTRERLSAIVAGLNK
ncbi:MAG: enoyl-CoA hydratase/isomerase family protein [bacterium]|nr:enoyl-CoA hydratase/isomerase family protein [bacterium]